MTLRVQNNITAMNAHKNLQAADSAMAKSLERLSSGYRINRAADDAAGLGISSTFRANIASFKVASRNTSEANSLLQVAEGGMEQIENMLTRLKELSTQAASANVSDADRTKINSEGNALISEIDRIAQNTKYGSTKLLDGTFGASQTAGSMALSGGTNMKVYGDMSYVYTIGAGTASGAVSGGNLTITSMPLTMSAQTFTFSASGTTLKMFVAGVVTDVASITLNVTTAQTLTFDNLGITITTDGLSSTTQTASWDGATLSVKDTGVTNLNVAGASSGSYVFSPAGTGSITLVNTTTGSKQTISSLNPGTAQDLDFDLMGVSFSIGTDYTENDLEDIVFTVSATGTGNEFQVGAGNTAQDRISLSLGSVRATASAGLALTFDYLDDATQAQSMLDLVDCAISTLASRRGDVGASMNRLSYAAANLATTIENTQSAESVIRDVDMADEMTSFTKNQILVQAGTAMLSQANQSPQMLLSLLQG